MSQGYQNRKKSRRMNDPMYWELKDVRRKIKQGEYPRFMTATPLVATDFNAGDRKEKRQRFLKTKYRRNWIVLGRKHLEKKPPRVLAIISTLEAFRRELTNDSKTK